MLYTKTVETGTLDLIRQLMKDSELSAFNLVGGTALSLQLGHRKSIDIDLFTDKDFNANHMARHLSAEHQAQKLRTLPNGVFSFIHGIKVDIIAHQYPVLNKVLLQDGIRMLSLEDIGAMKLNAILNNGTRLKDFADVYRLLEKVPLQKLTEAFERKYPDVNKQMAHGALLYHVDVNKREKIDYIGKNISFNKIQERLQQAVANQNKIFKSERQELKDTLLQKVQCQRRGKDPRL